MITETLFQRDCCFTSQHVQDLRTIADTERRARADIEPRWLEDHPIARHRLSTGPALLVVLALALLA